MSDQNRVLTEEANPNVENLALVPPTVPAIGRKLRFQNYENQTASKIQIMLEIPRRENRIGISQSGFGSNRRHNAVLKI